MFCWFSLVLSRIINKTVRKRHNCKFYLHYVDHFPARILPPSLKIKLSLLKSCHNRNCLKNHNIFVDNDIITYDTPKLITVHSYGWSWILTSAMKVSCDVANKYKMYGKLTNSQRWQVFFVRVVVYFMVLPRAGLCLRPSICSIRGRGWGHLQLI